MTNFNKEGEIGNILLENDFPSPIKIDEIAHSTSAAIYRIDFEKQGSILARIYPINSNSTESDYNILKKLYQSKISVPEPIKLINNVNSNTILLMEFLSGPLLSELLIKSKEIPFNLFENYADTLLSIHNFDWKKVFLKTKTPNLLKKPDFFIKSIVKYRKNDCKAFGMKKETKNVLKWLNKEKKNISSAKGYLLHDFHPFNIIVEKDGMRMIDWENAQIGDNRMDLAFAALSASVFHGKKSENYIIERYHKSGLPVDDLEFFMVAEALHRIVKLYRVLTPSFSEYKIYSTVFNYLLKRVEQITELELNLSLSQ